MLDSRQANEIVEDLISDAVRLVLGEGMGLLGEVSRDGNFGEEKLSDESAALGNEDIDGGTTVRSEGDRGQRRNAARARRSTLCTTLCTML